MKKVIITAIMLVLAMFMLTTNVQAYSMSFSGTKTTVEPGETFNVTVSVDEATTRANGHIKYDSSLFTFVSSTGSNMTANATSGTVQWLYSEPVGQETGANSFTFTFKAADVTETKKGTFTMEDFIAITKTNEEGYGQDKNTIGGTSSVEVTINKKADEPSEPTWKITPSGDFTLEKGESKQLTADGDVTWSTSDSSVATVDQNGKVTGVGEGNATITATDKDGNKQTVTVTVKDNSQTPGDNDNDNETHDNWSIEPSEDFSLKVGDKKKLTADGEGVEWKSSNEKVAKVDQNGNVTAVGAGTATITATDKYGNTKTIKVTVTKKTTTAGKKDNTQSPDSKLPQTGENAGKFVVLGIAGIVLAAGIVFKKKAKELDKLFVLLPIVAVLSLSGTVHAVKLADTDNLQAGAFTNLISGKNVLAINPKKAFETKNVIDVEVLKNIFGENSEVKALKDKDGKTLDLTTKPIPTGAVATIAKDSESKDYVILLYGDANGDGKICDVSDIDVIRQDYVFNKKADGVYKLAADLYVDSKLDVRDIQRMVSKYLGNLDGGLVSKFPGDEGTTPTDPSDTGETDDLSIAVAKVESTGKMYKTLQYAVNAVGSSNDKITLLKNSTENVTIADKGDLTIDFNGNDFTTKQGGYGITIAGNVSFVNSKDKESKFTGKEKAIVNITKDNAKVTFGKGIKIDSAALGAAVEIAEGKSGVEVSMSDASWSNSATGCFVQDNGKDTKVNILTGKINAYDFIVKQGKDANTTITIGDKSKEISETDPYIQTRDAWWSQLNENTIINMYNGKISTRNGLQQFKEKYVDGFRDDAFLYVNQGGSEAYYKKLADGQTLQEEEAVASVMPQNALFTSAQKAVDYASTGERVVLLKEINETLNVSEDKSIILDLNGFDLKGTEETFYTIATAGTLSVVNNGEKEATIDRPSTTDYHDAERGKVTGADIWVKESGNVSVGDNIELVIQISGGANIVNTGSGDITVDGADFNAENVGGGVHAIRDNGENSDLFIFKGDLETQSGQGKIAVRKSSSGNLYIGKNSKDTDGVPGIQEEILLKNKTEDENKDELFINGNVDAKNAQIYYFNGEIKDGTLIYKDKNEQEENIMEPVLRDGARLVKQGNDVGLHYEKLAEGELPISYSLYFSKDQVTEGVPDAVCYLTDDTEFGARQNFYRYFKTVQDAVNVEPNGAHENFNGVSPNEGGKLNIISLMKKSEDENKEATVTESIDIPKDKKVFLFGDRVDTQTLIGEADENYTIKNEGDLVVKNMTILKDGITSSSENTDNKDEYLVNVLIKDSGSLELQDNTILKLRDATNSENIRNEGSGDIIIDGAEISSVITHSRPNLELTNTIGIYDTSSESDIYIKKGTIKATTAICKKNSGKLTIGEKDSENPVAESSLCVYGTSYCLDVCSSTDVYFYNGKLKTDLSDKLVCCESTNNGAGEGTEHKIKEGNSKLDIVVENRAGTSVYYVEDGEATKNPMAWDVATGEKSQAAKAAALQANKVQVANVATMLALDIFNQ